MNPASLQGKLPGGEENLLNQLPPLAMPENISSWPPAPGWWILALLLLALVFSVTYYLCRIYQNGRRRRLAIKEVNNLWQHYQQTGDPRHYLQRCNNILRRFCIQQYPDAGFPRLTGEQWLQALDQLVGKTLFNSTNGNQLLEVYQQQQPNTDIASLHTTVKEWFNSIGHRHRTSPDTMQPDTMQPDTMKHSPAGSQAR